MTPIEEWKGIKKRGGAKEGKGEVSKRCFKNKDLSKVKGLRQKKRTGVVKRT